MPSYNEKRGVVRFSDTGAGGGGGSNVDSLFADVSLLCHFDGADGATTFTDSSSNSLTLTAVGDAQLDTAQFKYGTASLLLDGTGDSVTLPNNAVLNLTADYCIEFWFRINTSTSAGTFINLGDNGSSRQAQLVYWDGTNIEFYSSSAASTYDIANALEFGTPSNLTWHYVKISRIDNVYLLSMDGVIGATFTSSLTPISGTNHAIGNDPSTGSTPLACHMDELRITKGESRVAFDTPTAAFPDSA